jgi:hypothetical protein
METLVLTHYKETMVVLNATTVSAVSHYGVQRKIKPYTVTCEVAVTRKLLKHEEVHSMKYNISNSSLD